MSVTQCRRSANFNLVEVGFSVARASSSTIGSFVSGARATCGHIHAADGVFHPAGTNSGVRILRVK
eukprot:5063460-Pyramimonas_sp.AAC.1